MRTMMTIQVRCPLCQMASSNGYVLFTILRFHIPIALSAISLGGVRICCEACFGDAVQ